MWLSRLGKILRARLTIAVEGRRMRTVGIVRKGSCFNVLIMGMFDFLRLLQSLSSKRSLELNEITHTLDGTGFGGGTGVASFSGTLFLFRLDGGGFLAAWFGGLSSGG